MKVLAASVVAAVGVAFPAASLATTNHTSNIAWCRVAVTRSVAIMSTKSAEQRLELQEIDLLVSAIVAAGNNDAATVGTLTQQVQALQVQDKALGTKESAQIASFNAARARC